MKKGPLVFLIVTGLLKVALCSFPVWNMFVSGRKTWSEAREYCRESFTDLLSINSNEEENQILEFMKLLNISKAWIGLYKDVNDTWRWSGGKNASFFNWVKQKNSSNEYLCATTSRTGWRQHSCEKKYDFFCYQSSLTLVKENKTWEEAVEQCRHKGTGLVSLPSESALVETLQVSREAQTEHVWIGLRYLAGSWLWVNGEIMEYQAWRHGEMPQCPALSRRCGALSLVEHHWDSWDCADKLNFVCY